MNVRCEDHEGLREFALRYLGVYAMPPTWTDKETRSWVGIPLDVPAGRDLIVRWLVEGDFVDDFEGRHCPCRTVHRDDECPCGRVFRHPYPHCADYRELPEVLAECVARLKRGEEPPVGVFGPKQTLLNLTYREVVSGTEAAVLRYHPHRWGHLEFAKPFDMERAACAEGFYLMGEIASAPRS